MKLARIEKRTFSENSAVELLPLITGAPDPIITKTVGIDSATNDTFNPRLNIAYYPNDDSMVYFEAAKGFRSGAITSTSIMTASNATLGGTNYDNASEPDTLWNYTLGGKWDLGSVQIDLAAFFYDWGDAQIEISPALQTIVIPIGDIEGRGIDLTIAWDTPIDGLSPWFFVIFSFVIVFLVSYFFYKTKAGLILRAVGESHNSAHALGYSVIKIRFLSILFGGSMCALAGSYISICYAPMWQEGMTAGRGWIALALVVFATWKPERVLIGAYIFGGVTILQMNLQALGLRFPGQFFSMAPYVATIIVLVLISSNKLRIKLSAPASLTIPFYKGR